eukprot:6385818-Amphidinium_carterae.1
MVQRVLKQTVKQQRVLKQTVKRKMAQRSARSPNRSLRHYVRDLRLVNPQAGGGSVASEKR